MERLKDVERCLVHLDLVNLDIDQVKLLSHESQTDFNFVSVNMHEIGLILR